MKICLLIVDCLRPDHLGCYGYSKNTSPMIDRVAGQCVRCENVYAQANWTYPSVYAMLTGRYPTVLSVQWFDQRINGKFKMLPEQLADIGFDTSIFSNFKVLLNGHGFCSHFNDVKDVGVDRNAYNVFSDWLKNNDNAFCFFHIGEYVHEPYFASDNLVEKFIEESSNLEQIRSKKLIQVLTDRDTTGNELRKTIGRINKGLLSPSAKEIDLLLACYDAGISYIDEIVYRLYEMLCDHGDDYLFILTADHGQAFMEHGYFGHGLSLYNEVLKVPLIIDYSGQYQGNIKTDLQLADLYPTILDCLGMENDADLNGVSFWDGLASGAVKERMILSEGFPGVSIIRNRHKLISTYSRHWTIKSIYRQFMRHDKTASWPRLIYSYLQKYRKEQLFDLESDPGECLNIVRTQKDTYRALNLALGTIMQKVLNESLPAEDVYLDKEIEEQLVNLGYL